MGQTHVVDPPASIGRRPDAEIQLADPTVSRAHARIERTSSAWRIVNVSSGNGVFVDGAAVPPGDAQVFGADARTLQVGGVVLRMSMLHGTRPVIDPVDVTNLTGPLTGPLTAPPHVRADGPLITLVRDGDRCDVQCNGRFVPIKPLTSTVLFALAEQAGQLVHEWDLREAVGRDFHLSQAISDVRRVLRKLITEGWIDAAAVRRAVLSVGAPDVLDGVDDDDPAALARRVLFSRRGHGYVLLLPPSWFALSNAG